eukprot:SAG11_NODE_245_length_11735_cov_3.939068_10_plen_181_part_00
MAPLKRDRAFDAICACRCISLLRSCYLIGAVEFCVESMAPLCACHSRLAYARFVCSHLSLISRTYVGFDRRRKELARHKKTAPWLASTEQHFYALELDVRCDQEGMGAGEQAESGASAVSSEVSDQLMHIFEQAESAYELNISTIAVPPLRMHRRPAWSPCWAAFEDVPEAPPLDERAAL